MNDATYKKLLKELQKLQKRLVAAYVEDARSTPAQMDHVTERWRAAEVGGRVDDYLDVCARRSAVQLLLRTVYVRVLEDLGALQPPRIRGQWGLAAFKDVAPALGLRGYLGWVFRDLAKDFPALFTPGPDELPLPAEDLVREIWELWHQEDGKAGLVYAWRAAEGEATEFDSRFLGDLYQDLDAEVRKRFALLQTPVFVEEYILDHTLTPALAEFDPAALRANGETFRLIDPTCGSGHFLIGAFHRLADWWEQHHGVEKVEAARRALESVWGADLNPHAVDIARFRLLLEVRARTGVADLDRLAALPLNLAVMDTLIPWERLEREPELFPERDRLSRYGTALEREANARFLAHDFHVVVGNPPYITPKDAQKRSDYRNFWPDSCHMGYSLSAPYLERFFALGACSARVGQITSNSFASRQFGSRLVSEVLPKWDLSAIVDTSGAYIPGHGTPTVVLFGASRRPKSESVYCILGKRGEPFRPKEPSRGLVWTAIREAAEESDDSPFITVACTPRNRWTSHPWSLSGGVAGGLQEAVEAASKATLASVVHDVGLSCITGEDSIYAEKAGAWRRWRAPSSHVYPFVDGQSVRDYAVVPSLELLLPLSSIAGEVVSPGALGGALQRLWRAKGKLRNRVVSGSTRMEEAGKTWYEVRRLSRKKFDTVRAIVFPLVATHNHFASCSEPVVYQHGAPIIKLPYTATEDDHLDLLGLLNSSTLGFWMRQVFHAKGGDKKGDGARASTEQWSDRLEYDATKLKMAPLTKRDRPRRVALARALDAAAQERATCLPDAVLSGDWTAADLAPRLADARTRHAALTHRMVALQEELDWLTYQSYGLLEDLDVVPPDEVETLSPGHRPFEILAAQADDDAPPEEKSAWWSRHGHPRATVIPSHYGAAHRARLQARIEAIEGDDKLQLLESFPFKRRWQLPNLNGERSGTDDTRKQDETQKAARSWLLDRLEDLFAEGGALATPRPYRLEEIVAAWTADPRVAAAAAVAERSADVDLTLVAEGLLAAEALPDNPRRVYTPSGLRQLGAWKEVWHLQDREDRGESGLDIPKPPEFSSEDFVKPAYFSIRGKLNVPRERFIAFADLKPVRYGWNGWRDLERGLAQVEAFTEAESDAHDPLPAPSHADPRRCGVTLGLWESLDDVRRWSGADDHRQLASLAEEACRQTSCPCDLVKRWQAWVNGEFEVQADLASSAREVTVEDRAALVELVRTYRSRGASLQDLQKRSSWSGVHVAAVLDDLVASGDIAVSGKGLRRMFSVVVLAGPETQIDLL